VLTIKFDYKLANALMIKKIMGLAKDIQSIEKVLYKISSTFGNLVNKIADL
jgi:hypothetical protein